MLQAYLANIRREFAAPIGDASDFRRSVIFPQLYVFVCLVVVGSILGESLAGLFLKLVMVAYLLLAYALLRSRLVLLTHTLLGIEMIILCALLCVGASALGLPVIGHVFLPTALVIFSLFVVHISWRVLLACAISLLIVLALYASTAMLLGEAAPVELTLGFMLVGAVAVLAASLSYVVQSGRVRRRANDYENFMSLNFERQGIEPGATAAARAGPQGGDGELSHVVNNSLQEMVEALDSVRALVCASGGIADENMRAGVLEHLSDIEAALSFIGWTVSDGKVLAELERRTLPARLESMSFQDLKSELESYGRWLARGKDGTIEVLIPGAGEESFSVAGRDYLLSALRRLLRKACGARAGGAAIEVECQAGSEANKLLVRTLAGVEPDEYAVDLLRKIMRMSRGVFQRRSGERGGSVMSCDFQRPRQGARAGACAGSWFLLIDDAPQILSFYERVATALGLRAFSAASRAKALELVEQHGRPRLVITDLRLADGDALELIEELRRRFGAGLPVLVVSGSSEGAGRVSALPGRQSFLLKPVNRRALFEAVSSLLEEAEHE